MSVTLITPESLGGHCPLARGVCRPDCQGGECEYFEKGPNWRRRVIFATDFDGTIVENAYPKIGRKIVGAIPTLKQMRSEGICVILYTCRQGEALEDALLWCDEHGLEFDAVNLDCGETLVSWEGQYDGENYKPFADRYLDDRNIGTVINKDTWARALAEMRALNAERQREEAQYGRP